MLRGEGLGAEPPGSGGMFGGAAGANGGAAADCELAVTEPNGTMLDGGSGGPKQFTNSV